MNQSLQSPIKLEELSALVKRALHQLGLSCEHADTVHDVLMYAQMRGKTQGLIKIVERTVEPAIDAQPAKVEHRFGCMSHVRARGEVGMVIVRQAVDIAAAHAVQLGVGLVTTSHTSTSTGSIGYYARELALKDQIGIVMAGSPKSMAVYGGVDPVLGTNPIAIALPCYIDTHNEPLVLDMAAAAFTYFGLIEAKHRGESIPADVAWDAHGQPTIDPAAALSGALKAFAGAKGSGLGLMIECLTGPLAGAGIIGDEGDNRGNLVMAINPAAMLDADTFNQRVTQMVEHIQQGRTDPAFEKIVLPGQHGAQIAKSIQQRGVIDIDTSILDALTAIARGNT